MNPGRSKQMKNTDGIIRNKLSNEFLFFPQRNMWNNHNWQSAQKTKVSLWGGLFEGGSRFSTSGTSFRARLTQLTGNTSHRLTWSPRTKDWEEKIVPMWQCSLPLNLIFQLNYSLWTSRKAHLPFPGKFRLWYPQESKSLIKSQARVR